MYDISSLSNSVNGRAYTALRIVLHTYICYAARASVMVPAGHEYCGLGQHQPRLHAAHAPRLPLPQVRLRPRKGKVGDVM